MLPKNSGPARFLTIMGKEVAKSLKLAIIRCVDQIKTMNGDFSHRNLKDYPVQILTLVYLISFT
jgi:hypothetical protein